MDLSKLEDVCKNHRGSASEYYIDPIPEKKSNNARGSLNIPPAEQIIALIDFTVFGSAKDAMAVAESGLFWKQIGTAPTYLSWEQLRNCTISEDISGIGKTIKFGDELKMDLSGAGTLSKKENSIVLQLLNDLKALAGGKAVDVQPSLTPEGVDSGLVECEFCKVKIKPEVTYCKHCGIKLRG